MDEKAVVHNISLTLVVEEDGVLTRKLDENYQKLFSSCIPYKALGYTNIRSLLQAHPKLFKIVQSPEGEKVIVSAIEDTAHVVSFVKSQKKSKSKPARRTAPKANSTYSRPTWYPNIPNRQRRDGKHSVPPRFQENMQHRRTEFRLDPSPPSIQCSTPQFEKTQHMPQVLTGFQRPRFAPSNNMVGYQPSFSNYINKVGYQPSFSNYINKVGIGTMKKETSRQKVLEIAQQKNLVCNVNTVKAINGFSAKVEFGEKTYASGGVFRTESIASEAAFSEALRDLTRNMRELSVTKDEEKVVKRLKKVLEGHLNGMFSNNIEKKYQDIYSEALPNYWLDLARPEFAINSLGDRHIIYPSKPAVGITSADLKAVRCPSPLLLPESSYLMVTITCVACTTSVYIRIIEVLSDPPVSYQAKYDELLYKMDQFFAPLQKTQYVNLVTIGKLYGAYIDDVWQRVQVEKKLDETNFLCFLVDVGDGEHVNLKDLYDLPNEFAQLPFQAIRCSLKGLELFADDPVATKRVQASDVVGQTAVVRIEEKRVDPLSRQMTLDVTMWVNLELDSKRTIEFNLNEEVKKSIVDEAKAYQKLQKMAVELAVITSTGEDNVVYCHKPSVIKQIEAFMETFKTVKGLPVESNNNIGEDDCLLVEDEDRWKRARFIDNCIHPTHIQVQLIDYGSHVIIPREKIRSLSKIMPMLCELPQAYKCKMLNVPNVSNFSEMVINFNEGKQIFLKVLKVPEFPSEPYFVDILKQITDGSLLSLADYIQKYVSYQDWIKRTVPTEASNFQRVESSSQLPTPSPTSYLVGNMRQLDLTREDGLHVVALEGVKIPPNSVPVVAPDGYLDVIPTAVVSPSKFWIQWYHELPLCKQFTFEMTEQYSDEEKPLWGKNVSVTNAIPGKCYAFKYEEFWYRVFLEEIKVGASFQGILIDYGDTIVGQLSGLRTLVPRFSGRPAFATFSSLADAVPPSGTWTQKECLVFQQLVLNIPLVSKIISTDEGPLVLKMYDTSGEKDVIIAVELKNRLKPMM